MLKLIIGVKGTGKTKTLISMVNEAVDASHGDVVCIEKGTKLRFDVKYQARLVNAEEYFIDDAHSLWGFIAGIMASNHDVTELFVDSALKICKEDVAEFDAMLDKVAKLSDSLGVKVLITSSLPVEEATDAIKKYV
jgi:ABC-type phosphate/phosphonate transport system ATPase subunit